MSEFIAKYCPNCGDLKKAHTPKQKLKCGREMSAAYVAEKAKTNVPRGDWRENK